MSLRVPAEVTEALQSVRDDGSPEDFVVAGYDDDDSLKVLSSGTEGVAGIKAALPSSDVAYALLRRKFTWEKAGTVTADTTKFIFVLWRPDAIPLKRKMMIGRFDGQVKKLFSSYHTDLDINDEDELSNEIVDELIAKITQTADRVTDRKAGGMYLGGAKLGWNKTKETVKPDSRAEFKVVKGANIKWDGDSDAELAEAIADVRNDATETRWCLATYLSKDTLTFAGKGDGDVTEMLEQCTDTQVSYGLFRIDEQYDKTVAVRFCFVNWQPPNVPVMAKALIATHQGAVFPIFRPFMLDFTISEKEELDEDIAREKITGLTGTRSHVTDRKQTKKKSVYARMFLGGVKNETQKLEYEDKEAIDAAIADVRSDGSSTDWVVAQFVGERKGVKLALAGSGAGGITEMVDAFAQDKIAFGLLRREEEVDRSTVVKFYLFHWHGEDVAMTTAGNAGIFTGAVLETFGTKNDDVHGSSVEEIMADAAKKIQGL